MSLCHKIQFNNMQKYSQIILSTFITHYTYEYKKIIMIKIKKNIFVSENACGIILFFNYLLFLCIFLCTYIIFFSLAIIM